MKKLPSIYKNKINKNITNNSTVYYCTSKNIKKTEEKQNIYEFLDRLFNEMGYSFNKPVIIKTKDNVFETAIIRKENNKLLTLTDDYIDIDDIISIKRY